MNIKQNLVIKDFLNSNANSIDITHVANWQLSVNLCPPTPTGAITSAHFELKVTLKPDFKFLNVPPSLGGICGNNNLMINVDITTYGQAGAHAEILIIPLGVGLIANYGQPNSQSINFNVFHTEFASLGESQNPVIAATKPKKKKNISWSSAPAQINPATSGNTLQTTNKVLAGKVNKNPKIPTKKTPKKK